MGTITRGKPVEVDASGAAVAPATADPVAWARYFDDVYRTAGGVLSNCRWASDHANDAVIAWMNAEAPSEVRPGARAIVVGCGLGHDVTEIAARGYDAVGFDVSPTAIEWARRLHPHYADRFEVADLFRLPPDTLRRFDLVVEACTLQALHPSLREKAAAAIVSLMRPHGCLLVMCRGREEGELLENVEGPPFPLTPSELCGLFEAHGLHPTRPVDDFYDDEDPPKHRLRAAFRRR